MFNLESRFNACLHGLSANMRFAGADLDLDLELSVKPVIQELVRTQVCFPNLKLLVERITVVTLLDVDELSGNEAYKLTLTDGEKTIQGGTRFPIIALALRLTFISSPGEAQNLQDDIQRRRPRGVLCHSEGVSSGARGKGQWRGDGQVGFSESGFQIPRLTVKVQIHCDRGLLLNRRG